MRERTGEITFKGNPLTLLGEPVAVGDAMPVFAAIADDLSERSFADVKGDVTIVSSVPSLDTGVCAIQTQIGRAHV